MLAQTQKEAVFRFIQNLKGSSFTFRDVVRFLDLDSDERRSLQRYLDELDAQEIIHRIKRGRYALPSREALLSGVLTCHRDGYGFVTPDDHEVRKQDIFVPARNMEDALHGDRVLIKIAKKKRPQKWSSGRRRHSGEAGEDRVEGTVVRVLERRHPSIVARYYEHPRFPFAVPLDSRFIHDIRIPFQHSKGAQNGQIVVVALTVPPGRHQNPEGRVTVILGFPGDPLALGGAAESADLGGELQELAPGKLVVKVGLLRNVADPRGGPAAIARHVAPARPEPRAT